MYYIRLWVAHMDRTNLSKVSSNPTNHPFVGNETLFVKN